MTKTLTEARSWSRRLASTATVLAFGAIVSFPASPARAEPAEPRASARAHFSLGVELASAGSYEAALAEFTEAYRIFPHFSVLYNIGQAELALDRPTLAVESWRRYLSEGGEQIEPARRAEVRESIARELERSAPATAPSKEEPVGVAPAVPSSDEPAARAEPAPSPPRRAAAAPAPAHGAPGRPQRTVAYVLGAAGIVLASAALAHYAWNRGRFEDWQDEYSAYHRDPRPERRSSANALAVSVENASRITAGLAIGAGVALGTGTVLLLSSQSGAPTSGKQEVWLGVRAAF
jgi:hypothetical protein